ncbi:MAG: thioredoxin family protein [Alphaproteobacteria bacterium]|nr:thioredoxin family protein [Alphaproteobacteria bacterium]
MRRTRFLLHTLYIATLLIPAPAQAQTPASEEPRHAQIRVLPERNTLAAGEILTIAIEQTLEDGWHSYWINAGDSGTPPEIFWTLPAGFVASEINWPTPHKILYSGLLNYGYEDTAILLQRIQAPDPLPTGPLTLAAEFTILVCKDICIPETSRHSFTLNDGTVINHTTLITDARSKMPRTEGWSGTYSEENGVLIATVTPQNPSDMQNIQIDTAALIPYEWGVVDNPATVTITTDKDSLILRQKRGDRALTEIKDIRTLLTYNDKDNILQGVELTLTATIPAAGTAAPSFASDNSPLTAAPGPSQPLSLLTALLFAVLGGLILNLMPCVFPVLSLKAISLSKMSDKEQTYAAVSGLAYTAGIILSFSLIAAILMALKAGGAQIGWGFQLQNPMVVYALALLLFVIGLNLSGVFLLQGSFTNAGQKLAQQNGWRGAFFTGVLATLVATPCTAPFMGVAMGFALTQPAVQGMTIFLALGLGLALPYLLLTLIPPLRKLLPRPGAWMETFKQFLAFPMYASAAWLVWVFAQQAGGMSILAALTGMIAVAFTLWAWGHRPQHKLARFLVSSLILLIFIAGLATGFAEALKPLPMKAPATVASHIPADGIWESFSQNRLDELLQGDEAVFVDMTAAWCITCKVNERVALDIPETRMLFAEKGVRALKGDWTNQNPEITKFLDSHGRKGVPLYVYYGPRDPDSGLRPAPVVLPQILTPALVAATIR